MTQEKKTGLRVLKINKQMQITMLNYYRSKTYLSNRRRVESKQLANMQLASLDMEIQFTGCPKLSDISLFVEKGKKECH